MPVGGRDADSRAQQAPVRRPGPTGSIFAISTFAPGSSRWSRSIRTRRWSRGIWRSTAADGMILDQGQEGACTGFGLAACVNYLHWERWQRDGCSGQRPARVSTRMLYHMARLYDEWPGEDYDGSSCRGAMKGWHHHGVCDETLWPYAQALHRAQGGLAAGRRRAPARRLLPDQQGFDRRHAGGDPGGARDLRLGVGARRLVGARRPTRRR